MSSDTTLLQLKGISKAFGATQALRNVDLTVRSGEVHALIGENGAGKSTLMKILSGAYRADRGVILLDGKPCHITSPAAGRALGIAMIYQELTLAPHLTVEENLTLGMERTTLGFVRRQRDRIARALDILQHRDLPLGVQVRTLPLGLQQVVEIARALISEARVIIMDEPTSSLSASDAQALFAAIRRLKQAGMAVIYISHFLEEVAEVADVFTVLRDGETVGAGRMAETSIARIIEMMVGRTLTEMFPRTEHAIGDVLLRVEGLDGTPIPRGVSFVLRRGEILGIAGLVGAGRSETLRRLFGLDRAKAGVAELRRERTLPVVKMVPRRALALGMDFLSENRKEEGLATGMTLAANVTLSSLSRFAGWGGWGFLRLRKEKESVGRWIAELNIRCQGAGQRLVYLSGGNQQKVALSRILEHGGDIILLDEPTRGVDVGSKVEIYRLIGRLAAEGKGILFVSSYLPELFGICDTLAVMHRGRMSAIRPVSEWTEHEVMRVATSGQ
ncbi:MAG: sugar ABC transporter ATP-binding protein [Candidatus Sumerlaeia bacterium]|nr:sugar ABC transporter ATP-binding protein [Candidatus Sumerlaeia bacterium]